MATIPCNRVSDFHIALREKNASARPLCAIPAESLHLRGRGISPPFFAGYFAHGTPQTIAWSWEEGSSAMIARLRHFSAVFHGVTVAQARATVRGFPGDSTVLSLMYLLGSHPREMPYSHSRVVFIHGEIAMAFYWPNHSFESPERDLHEKYLPAFSGRSSQLFI
jgi:hypothetical protein